MQGIIDTELKGNLMTSKERTSSASQMPSDSEQPVSASQQAQEYLNRLVHAAQATTKHIDSILGRTESQPSVSEHKSDQPKR